MHIGYGKAGSSFLQRWFKRHPQLHYTRRGLAGFDNVSDIIDLARDSSSPLPRYYVTSRESLGAAWWNARGAGGVVLARRQYHDGNQMAQDQARVCEILSHLFPQSLVLIVTRGYAGILRSGYSEYVKMGGHLPWEACLEKYRPFLEQWLDINYLVGLYATAFGEANLIVLPYELLRDDPGGFLTLLEQRLGLDHYAANIGRVNPSLRPQEMYWYARFSQFIIAPLAGRLSKRGMTKLYRKYSRKWIRRKRLRRWIKLLDRLCDKKVVLDDFPPGYLEVFRPKGTVLRENPLYASYGAAYLWEEPETCQSD